MVRLVVSSCSMTGRTTGMLGVRSPQTCEEIKIKTVSDVEIHHLEKFKKLHFENITIAAEGPLRASLKSEVKYGQSTISVMVCTALLYLCICIDAL